MGINADRPLWLPTLTVKHDIAMSVNSAMLAPFRFAPPSEPSTDPKLARTSWRPIAGFPLQRARTLPREIEGAASKERSEKVLVPTYYRSPLVGWLLLYPGCFPSG